MTEAQAVELIMAQAASLWAADTGLQDTKLVLENEAMPEVAPFAQLTIGPIQSLPYTAGSAGSRRVEYRGLIFVKIWVPVDQGRRQLSQIADGVRSVFQGQVLSSGGDDLVILTGDMRSTAVDQGYYMGLVSLPLRFYGTY